MLADTVDFVDDPDAPEEIAEESSFARCGQKFVENGSRDFSERLRCVAVSFPEHALHEKGLQRQLGVGTLVSNQGRRALVVPRVNRWFCSSVGLHRNSFVRASRDTPRRVFFDCREVSGTVASWANRLVGVPSCPSPPRRRPAVRRPAPIRPWYVRVLDSRGSNYIPRRPEERIWRKTRSEKDVLFRACATGYCARRDYRQRDYSVQLYYIPRRTLAGALDAHLWCAAQLLAA